MRPLNDFVHLPVGSMPSGKCLAGFSGGADSTALIYLLAAERDAGKAEPEALHVNHGLRGEESDEDEEFCRILCEKLQIPFHRIRVDLAGRTDENSCREARFRSFRCVMDETGIRQLVLAHNRNDAAETFMMRLMRGAGTEGLACMSLRDERDGYVIYRPLLSAGRDEIRNALRQAGVSWREDSLNESDAFLRNRVRSRLIPLMEEMSPGSSDRIAHTVLILNEENYAMQRMAESFLARHSQGCRLDADALLSIQGTLQGRILRAWWKQNAPILKEHALNARQTADLIRLAGELRGKANMPGGIIAVKCRHGLYLTGLHSEDYGETSYRSGEIRFGKTVLRSFPSQGNCGDGILSQEVPDGFLKDCVIRTRRPGDRIRPFGMEGSRKLQDYLTDRGIDEPWRNHIPLICRGNEVLMAAGVGSGAVPKWNAEAVNVRLVWSGELPWTEPERGGKNNESER